MYLPVLFLLLFRRVLLSSELAYTDNLQWTYKNLIQLPITVPVYHTEWCFNHS